MPKIRTQNVAQGKLPGRVGQVGKKHRDPGYGAIAEEAESRRASVYRTDVEFAPEPERSRCKVLPERSTPERYTILKLVADMRALGMTQLAIGDEVGFSQATVCNLLREWRELNGESTQA